MPGVRVVAQASKVPLSPGRSQGTFRLPAEEQTHELDINAVSADYFAVLGLPIVKGRTFTRAELDGGARAAIVTEATARRFWQGEDPVGRTIVAASSPEAVLEIVGVVRDAHVSSVANTESSYLYLPAQSSERRVTLLVRGETDFDSLAWSIGSTVRTRDAGLRVQIQPLSANLNFWRDVSRSVAVLSGSLSALALVLASIGVYGVVSYLVTLRRREVGIRMALGASPRAMQVLVLRETLRPIGVGVLLGALAAAASSRVLERGLFGISPFDPVAFGAAAVFMLAVGAMATVLPTRNALKVEPVDALRHD